MHWKNPNFQRPILLVLWMMSGCFSENSVPNTTFSGPDEIQLSVTNWRHEIISPNAIPRRPIIEFHLSESIDDSDQPAMLIAGQLDDGLIKDLAKSPLNMSNTERQIASEVTYSDKRITLQPIKTLQPGATLTALVAGWAHGSNGVKVSEEGQSSFFQLTVSQSEQLGAQAQGSWPADGTHGVAVNLAYAAVYFDGAIQGIDNGIWLEDPNGFAVPAKVRERSCKAMGWKSGTCIAVEPSSILKPNSRYQIVVGSTVQDATGAPVGIWTTDFYTSNRTDHQPPNFTDLSCAIDETPFDHGCGLIDDHRISLRLHANEPVRFRLDSSELTISTIALRGDVAIDLRELNPGTTIQAIFSAVDASGNQYTSSLELKTESELEKLSLTEVLADPLGTEPDQEFIEILNYGDKALDLNGYSISDQSDSVGDRIEQSVIVYPNERVLLVADRFDPNTLRDPKPPPGITLVRMGASLCTSGLANSGEDLFLRNPEGKRVSAAPGAIRPHPGTCIIRESSDMRDGTTDSFGYDPNDSCTPGK